MLSYCSCQMRYLEQLGHQQLSESKVFDCLAVVKTLKSVKYIVILSLSLCVLPFFFTIFFKKKSVPVSKDIIVSL